MLDIAGMAREQTWLPSFEHELRQSGRSLSCWPQYLHGVLTNGMPKCTRAMGISISFAYPALVRRRWAIRSLVVC